MRSLFCLSLLVLLSSLSLACFQLGPEPSPPPAADFPPPAAEPFPWVVSTPETSSLPPETVLPEAVLPEAVPPETVLPEAVPPEAVLPEAVPPQEAEATPLPPPAPPSPEPAVIIAPPHFEASPTPAPPPPPSPSPASADAARIFRAASAAMESAPSYRWRMEISTRSGGLGPLDAAEILIEGRFVAPDRDALEMQIGLGALTISVSAVSIGEDLYVLDPFTGEWSTDGSALSGSPSSPLALIEEDFPGSLAYAGLEEVRGEWVHHLVAEIDPEVLSDAMELGGGVSGPEADYWIGRDDLLFRSFRMSFSQREGGVVTDLALTGEFTDYGADLSVERPLAGEALRAARAECDGLLRARLASGAGAGDSSWVNSLVGEVASGPDSCGPEVWQRRATDWEAEFTPSGCFDESVDPAGVSTFSLSGSAIPPGLLDGDGSPSWSTSRDERGNMLVYWGFGLFGKGDLCWLYLSDEDAWSSAPSP